MARCTAKAKQTQEQCKSPAMIGKTTCQYHGGKSLSGITSPTYKTGRYSKNLPTRLAARYQQAIDDPELITLRDEVALLDSRISEVILKIDTGEAGAIWKELRETYADMQAATRQGDSDGVKQALSSLNSLIKNGAADYQQWGEIATLIEGRRKLVESESKRQQILMTMMTAEQTMMLVSVIQDVVMRNVDDRATRLAIQNELNGIIVR